MAEALILGAGSDMAVAIARRLAERKVNLVLAGRDMELLSDLRADLEIRYGVGVRLVYFDALDYASHRSFYSELGSPSITVCAFGYLGDQDKGMEDWLEAERILATNFTGAVSILNIVAADYMQRGSGMIVGISSVAGDRGRGSNYLYGSAKAGFTAYLSGLRNRAFKKGVTVITVKPGFAATRMTAHLNLPPALTASPEQVATAVVKGMDRKQNTVYVKGLWKWMMLVIGMIPENVFKKLSL
ncbi:MAG TPA: SDR family oxidoreductase [Dinghuibacter sp.]|uniref:SDR family oxidoreductase n=1 Tax=Dinghuibacter sp. TaxID=2024697 RepID=UPI002C1A9FAF|nr:SDR family oxidoreductase [Dinghuibacter sp.]HTJ11119.1 SDR family oxidoreductase [Dinghuibacter sp.]